MTTDGHIQCPDCGENLERLNLRRAEVVPKCPMCGETLSTVTLSQIISKRKSRPPQQCSFTVGESEKHTVGIHFSYFGKEVYTVDGLDVLRINSLSTRGVRQFELGEVEKHSIEIRMDVLATWKCFFSAHDWIAEAYVDGELVVEDLIPKMRRRINTIIRITLMTCTLILMTCTLIIAAVTVTAIMVKG